MADDNNISSYLFFVEIDGIETARFQKCEGLEAETSVFEYEEGGGEVHRFKGRTRFPNIILEKGITDNDSLFNWFKDTCLKNKKLERKNGSVVLKDLQDNEVKRWNFFRAFPCRWIGPKLDYKDPSTFAVERIEIAHEGIEVDNDSEPQEYNNWFHIGRDMSEETNFIGAEEASIGDSVYYDNYGNPSSDPNVVTGQNMGEITLQPRYFNQRDFSATFGDNFGNNACAATALLNEISEQYTENTGMQMTDEQANLAMSAAVNSGNVSSIDANINSWEGAANDMWRSTGEEGRFTYGGENPTATIYAEDVDNNGIPEHFTNSNGNGTYHDPWNGETGTVGDTQLQQSGLGPTRTLTYSRGRE
ncbi:MAG: phage tail protein [Treponema sp.]|nr:phage tail protein [Spirochaetales bacterium]MDY6190893.1 phage tail protein [Treponema sp.]